jgi:hypothetical protein
MRIAQALAIKSTLPLCLAGALLTGSAIGASSIITSVNSVPGVSAVAPGAHMNLAMSYGAPKMSYGSTPQMSYGSTPKMSYG